MSKNYSKKVRKLLERFENHSLKILLEEDEENVEDVNDPDEKSDSKKDSDDSDENEDMSFDFPKDNDSEDMGAEDSGNDSEDIDDSEMDLGDKASGKDIDIDGPSTKQLEDHLDNAVRDFKNQLDMSTSAANLVMKVDNQANSFLDNPNLSYEDDYINYEDDYVDYEDDYVDYEDDYINYEDDYVDYEDDYIDRLQAEGYQRKSIGRFIFEEKEEEDKVKQKKFDDLEAQIEKLEYLTDLMDDKFNRKTNQINEDDLPDILNKSIDLINYHDPVEYAHDETIKYITVKANPKLKERLIEDFKVMFNERCKKEGYDTSSITGMTTASPTKFKTGVTGIQS